MVTAYAGPVKEFVVYTAMRVGLFVASLVAVAWIWTLFADEVPVVWAVVIAFVVSGLASYFVLNRQREAFARRVERRAERMQERFEQMKSKEDVD
jgi:ABC-type bacteriocin/lantibiotic exporter with double-glycine peptidase domain